MKLKKVGKVYVITNTKNKKKYIGFTIHSIELRLNSHTKGDFAAAKLLHEAILEFGKENFTIKTIFEGTCEQALEKEKYFIKKLKTRFPGGYNIREGGLPFFLGRKHTVEARKKMSEARIGNKYASGHKPTAETKAKISAAKKGNRYALGYKHTSEARVQMSISRKGRKHTPETRAKMSMAQKGNKNGVGNTNFLGHKHSSKTKTKISVALKGNQHLLGYKHTQEAKNRIRDCMLGNNYRARMR